MKSTNQFSLWMLLAILLAVLAQPVFAASSTVRGRLTRVAPNGQSFPAQGIAVTVYNPQLGRSSPAYSGPDGMYYLYNIPTGSYTLEVWASNSPLLFQIQVYPQPYTDIARIAVP